MKEDSVVARLPMLGPPHGSTIHVMTYNLRHTGDSPPRDWPRRRALVRRLITAERPTLLGTQEATYRQVRDLSDDLPDYGSVWLSREGGSDGESMAIFYRRDRLRPLEFGHLWLSDTPQTMASMSWGNEVPRMLTWVRFFDLSTGVTFGHLNTHFDHQSEKARLRSAGMVRQWAAEFDAPVIVTGDFNDGQATPPHLELTAGGLTDTWDRAARHVTPRYATFNDWNASPFDGGAIDWILATDDVDVLTTGINTWAPGRRVPSDHWPVQALLTVSDRGA